MNSCTLCGGEYKIIKDNYPIWTRNPSRPKINIQLEFYQCIVCTSKKLTEESEKDLAIVRKKFLQDFDKIPENESKFVSKFLHVISRK